MKVVVIGATGATGQIALQKLLAQGHDVVAVARDPSSLSTKHERLTVVKGDARDAASLEAAVAGADAVFSSIGPRALLKKDDMQEVFMKNILAALKKTGVKRFVNLSAWGAGDSAPHTPLPIKLARATVLKRIFDDKDRGEVLLADSDVDYVSVRPGRLLNEPARGGVKASLDGKGLKPELTREDLATFMIEQLTDNTWSRKSPIIGY